MFRTILRGGEGGEMRDDFADYEERISSKDPFHAPVSTNEVK